MSDTPTETDDDRVHRSDDIYRVEFSGGTDEPSTTVVEAVAAITGRKQDELDPLYDAVETDALDSIFGSGIRSDEGDVVITFTYEGVDVVVRNSGVVEIERTDSETSSTAEGPRE